MLDITQKNQYECLKCLDKIVEFIRLIKYETTTEDIMKPTFTTKDYELVQWVDRIKKQIPKGTTLYDFQKFIGKGIEILDSNNIKGRKKKW